jgi:hypothetical protein
MQPTYDIVIIGAGPVGLASACFASAAGLRVALVERQSESSLAAPAFDGRDIALTHHSKDILISLGVWPRLQPHDIAPISVRNRCSRHIARRIGARRCPCISQPTPLTACTPITARRPDLPASPCCALATAFRRSSITCCTNSWKAMRRQPTGYAEPFRCRSDLDNR